MLPLKKSSSILQKLKSLFLSRQIRRMQTVFGQIELTHVETNSLESTQSKKDPEVFKVKQRYRQAVDYQQVKKKNDCLKQIQQLKNNIRQMPLKNQQIYEKIIKTSSNFTGVLFSPKNYNQTYKITNYDSAKIYQQKLLIELDKLYEQNCLLEKQLNRAKFIEQHQQKHKQDTFSLKINHYEFLRNVWQNNKNEERSNFVQDSTLTCKSQDFIEKLNKKVAMVKLGINRILKEQQLTQNSLISETQDDFVQKSPKYQKLLRLYQQAKMKIQQQTAFIEQRILTIQKNVKVEGKFTQIQNLNAKIKDLMSEISKKDEILLQRERQLEAFVKKEENLKFVFHTNESNRNQNQNQYQIKVYLKNTNHQDSDDNKQVQCYQTECNFSAILEQLVQQSRKLPSLQDSSGLNKLSLGHKRSLTDRKPISQFSLDQIHKDRLNLIKKTNILTENLSHYNTARRNFSKQKVVEKTPQIEKQKQNIIVGKFESVSKDEKSEVDFPNFQVNLASAETKTKFVRSSNRQR